MVQTSAPCPFVGRLALSPHGIVTTTYYWKSNQSNSKKVEILKIPINQTYAHVFLPFYIFETLNGIWTEVRRCFFNHKKLVSLLGMPENPQRPNHVFTLCLIWVEKVGDSETTSPTEQRGTLAFMFQSVFIALRSWGLLIHAITYPDRAIMDRRHGTTLQQERCGSDGERRYVN